MKEKNFEDLVYELKNAKRHGRPGAIVFLGAGCSITAKIPGTRKIIKRVLGEHSECPAVQRVWEEAMARADQAAQQTGRASASKKEIRRNVDYANLMEAIGSGECARIFKDIVEAKKVRINVSHIYLAQLVKEGYVDYILTTNFDNLAQRALALYNLFPPIYDLPSLENLGTEALQKQSITHLHGTYNGIWRLNSQAERSMIAEKGSVRDIFNRVSDNRYWIVIGYSGEALILEAMAKLIPFNNGLHWVGYRDEEPSDNVKKHLFSNPLSGAFWIKGYDSDKFFLKLNHALVAKEPEIIDQPFSFLKVLQGNIIDIHDKKKYEFLKYRLSQTKTFVEDAIQRYEAEEHGQLMEVSEIQAGKLKKKLVSLALSGKYEQCEEEEIKKSKSSRSDDLTRLMAAIYNKWGVELMDPAKDKHGHTTEALFREAIQKFEHALKIKPDLHETFYNWGTALTGIAKTKAGYEAETLYREACEKFARALEIKPDKHEAFNSWGAALMEQLAEAKSGSEAEPIYREAIEKFARTLEIKPDYHEGFNNWGTALMGLADTKAGFEAETLYREAIEKFARALEIKTDFYEAFHNWGLALMGLAEAKAGSEAEPLYREAIEKFARSVEIKPDYDAAYGLWSAGLIRMARLKTGDERLELLKEAQSKAEKAVALGGHPYNLACCHALLGQKEQALGLLTRCLEQGSIGFDHVARDADWDGLRDEPGYLALQAQYGGREE
jgi:tetratricopeptide (TPR) repeat protein